MAEFICVSVRVRPFNEREKRLNAELCIDMDGQTTTIRDSNGKQMQFAFDQSLWSHDGFQESGTGCMEKVPGGKYADQRDVFHACGKSVLNNALRGFHSCLCAYGQTGAGKSYSMVGYGANQGMIPLLCEDLFVHIAANSSEHQLFEVTLSMIEIYNETIQDLYILPSERPKKGLEVRESACLGVWVDGVITQRVHDCGEVQEFIDKAFQHRVVATTLMGATSSRGHLMLTIGLKQFEDIGGGETQVKISTMILADLAGSEKVAQTGALGDRLKEGAMINRSIRVLQNVIEKLGALQGVSPGKAGQVLVPYRDSKLTRLLQNACGGSCKTSIICAVSPASCNYAETLSSLRLVDCARKISNKAVANISAQGSVIEQLKLQNEELKRLMARISAGAGDVGQGAEITKEQKRVADIEKAINEIGKSFEQRLREAKEVVEVQVSVLGKGVVLHVRHPLQSATVATVKKSIDSQLKVPLSNQRLVLDNHILEDDSSRLESLGATGDEPFLVDLLKVSAELPLKLPSVPHFANLNQNPRLAGRIKYFLEKGKVTHLGSHKYDSEDDSQSQDSEDDASETDDSSTEGKGEDSSDHVYLLHGENIYTKHAYVTNQDGRCYLMSFGEPADATWINGSSVASLLQQQQNERQRAAELGTLKDVQRERDPEGILLQHGDRVIFGKVCFFFVDPTEGVAEMMIMSGQVDYQLAQRELMELSRSVT